MQQGIAGSAAAVDLFDLDYEHYYHQQDHDFDQHNVDGAAVLCQLHAASLPDVI